MSHIIDDSHLVVALADYAIRTQLMKLANNPQLVDVVVDEVVALLRPTCSRPNAKDDGDLRRLVHGRIDAAYGVEKMFHPALDGWVVFLRLDGRNTAEAFAEAFMAITNAAGLEVR